MKKRIAFLYLDKTFSVYHSIGTAIELSLLENTEVVAFTNRRCLKLLKEILSEKKNNVKIRFVKPYWYFQVPVYVEIKIQMRNFYFRRYKQELAGFDIIFSVIYNDLSLKEIIGKKPKVVFYDHGPANREISFSNLIKGYDYVLLHSKWELEVRKKINGLSSDKCSVIGYPKIDIINRGSKKMLFNNDNKVVLYNPHWDKNFSSYSKHGKEILNYFKNNPNQNLIFAPHSLLKERHYKVFIDVLKYKKQQNIIIDLGSEEANNMTYTRLSDIYLGDFSSQALEFGLLKPRPCIFIDSNNVSKKSTPISWGMGKVYKGISADRLSAIIEDAGRLFETKYKVEQIRIIKQIFTIPKSESSSSVAAKSLLNYIKNI
jgi:CDP-glycerol glycerophosphotransferase (TagB/SpsB family)